MAGNRGVVIRLTGSATGGRKAPRPSLVTKTGAVPVRRKDWPEQRSIVEAFPSVLALAGRPEQYRRECSLPTEAEPEPRRAPQSTPVAEAEAKPHSPDEIPEESQPIPSVAGAVREKEASFVRPIAPQPHSYPLRHRCVLCGYDRYGELNPWYSPRWITQQGWVICRTCYSVHRGPEGALSDFQPGGWVLPYDFVERNFRILPRHRSGLFVDCSPFGVMKGPCSELFTQSIGIQELHEMPTLQAEDITCYSCIETSGDIEWVMQLLLYHLAENGVLRINLLLEPFVSSPKAVGPWLEAKHIDVHRFPSRTGLRKMLDRLGLEVLVRMRTVNLPVATGLELPDYMKGFILFPWNAVRVARIGIESIANFGFGEELVLSRKHATPAEELLQYPRRPFRKAD